VKEVQDYIPQATTANTIILDGEILLLDTKTNVPLPFG
jgi:ATP-dependent DNA ligase